jgi:hypothetical protein
MTADLRDRLLAIPIAVAVIVAAAVAGTNVVVAVGIVGVVVGTAIAIWRVWPGDRRVKRALAEDVIRRSGILGRGTVVGATPTGRRRGDLLELDLTLDVQLPSRRRFEARRRDWLTQAERERIVLGHPIVVAADPAEPGHVVPVFDIPDVDPAAIAGLGRVAGGPGGPRRTEASLRPTPAEPEPDR